MRVVVIVGSSRKDGDTQSLVSALQRETAWPIEHLAERQISYYDYDHRNQDDDFLPLMRRLLNEFDCLVFATPVYWYAMSGQMKVFFDRFTDLLTVEKNLGRRLQGKKMAAISISQGNNLGEDFWLPFQETAKYLAMDYLGHRHTLVGSDLNQECRQFAHQLLVKF